MGDDILERLFYGQVSPFDDSVEDMDTFRELNHKMGELWARVESQAPAEVLELLDQYKVCRADMDMLVQLDRFKVGFRLGVQLLVAATGTGSNAEKST